MTEEQPVETLSRWSDSGAMWRVLRRTPTSITVSLRRCDDGEEVDRLTSSDPDLLTWIGDRSSSEDRPDQRTTPTGTLPMESLCNQLSG